MRCDDCGKAWDGKERFTTREVEHTRVRTLCEACAAKEAVLEREEQRRKKYTDRPPRW